MHLKSQRAPLVISETHRSYLILKYVCLFCFTNGSTDAQIHSRDVASELDASDEDSLSADDSGSDHDDKVAELENDGELDHEGELDKEGDPDIRPVMTDVHNGEEVLQDLETDGE